MHIWLFWTKLLSNLLSVYATGHISSQYTNRYTNHAKQLECLDFNSEIQHSSISPTSRWMSGTSLIIAVLTLQNFMYEASLFCLCLQHIIFSPKQINVALASHLAFRFNSGLFLVTLPLVQFVMDVIGPVSVACQFLFRMHYGILWVRQATYIEVYRSLMRLYGFIFTSQKFHYGVNVAPTNLVNIFLWDKDSTFHNIIYKPMPVPKNHF